MNGDARSLCVTHFPHHDDVGILSNKSTHGRGESQPDRGLNLRLIDAGNFVFDRILDREYFA